jgi:HEAT repeat protein
MPPGFFRSWAVGLIAGGLVVSAWAEELPPAPERLAQQLTASEVAVRREAAHQLNRLGPAAKPALPALIKALEDEDKQVWSSAVAVIATLGPEAKDAIPVLIAAFDSRSQRGRRARDSRQILMRNSYALTRIGPAAVPPLLEALRQEDAGLRTGAARALGPMGAAAREAVPLLINNLADGRDPVRDEAMTALGLIGPDAGPALVTALADGEARRRAGAAQALSLIDPPFRAAAPAVEQALGQEKDVLVRSALLTTLPKLGGEPGRSLAALLPAAVGEDEALRHAALNALLGTRSLRPPAITKLAALLKDPNAAVRERAARAIGRFGAEAAPALPELMNATRISGGAPAFADALAQIGSPALPVLLQALQTGKPEDSAWVLRALRGFGPPAVPVLSEALKHEKPAVRAAAASALGTMGRDAADAVNPLFVLTEDASPEVQAAALRALVAQRADSGRLKPLLQTALASSNVDVRKAGAAGTAALGGAAQLGVPGLLDLLADDDAAGRMAAVQALGQLGAQAAPAVEPLAVRLGDLTLQSAIIETLGKIGPAAAPAVPRLAELAKSTDQRASVLPTLTRIGAGASSALPLIYTCLNDPAADVRASAATAVAAVEPDKGKALATLIPLAADPSGRMRRTIAPALVPYGAAARPAVPALVRMLAVETERAGALLALKAIGVDNVPELKKMLAIKDTKVRTLACESLGSLGPAAKEAAPQLRELLAQDAALRAPITAALARIEAGTVPVP